MDNITTEITLSTDEVPSIIESDYTESIVGTIFEKPKRIIDASKVGTQNRFTIDESATTISHGTIDPVKVASLLPLR